ncbi:MAG: nicotinate-nucleotide diphosphorylase (carboxylating), partial [Thermoplasmata archaeon]
MTAGSRRPAGPLDRLVRAALWEDRTGQDRTTRAILTAPRRAVGTVTAQARGTLSGMQPARAIARVAGLTLRSAKRDGDPIRRGSVVLVLRGDARKILAVERTLLNFLMHASGVATATARAVDRAGPLQVWGTRKTVPGLRDLQKAAIRHGGGSPHRRDLAAAFLVKNNHLALVPLPEAVRRARRAARPGESV